MSIQQQPLSTRLREKTGLGDSRQQLAEAVRNNAMPDWDLLRNVSMFARPQELRRFLFMNEIYQRQMAVPGVIMEFGVRWGKNLSHFQSLRAIHEPYNSGRRVIGFDTFEGFPSTADADGAHELIRAGSLNVGEHYEKFLDGVLSALENESPVAELKKFELVKGDVRQTLPAYLEAHPETVVSMAYLDMDLYEPTRDTLRHLAAVMPKGGVIVFDEFGHDVFPGETLAVKEVLGIDRLHLIRSPYAMHEAYVVLA